MNVISVTPTVTASSAYTAGDAVGGKLEFSGCPEDGVIMGAVITDLAEQGIETDLILFSADFTETDDHEAFDVTAGDEANIIGVINFAAADFKEMGGMDVATKQDLNIPFKLASTASGRIYGQLVTRGTPTYADAEDVTVKLGVATR